MCQSVPVRLSTFARLWTVGCLLTLRQLGHGRTTMSESGSCINVCVVDEEPAGLWKIGPFLASGTNDVQCASRASRSVAMVICVLLAAFCKTQLCQSASPFDVGLARRVLGFPNKRVLCSEQFELRTAMRPFGSLSGGEKARARCTVHFSRCHSRVCAVISSSNFGTYSLVARKVLSKCVACTIMRDVISLFSLADEHMFSTGTSRTVP